MMNMNDMLNKFIHLILPVFIGTDDERSRLFSSSDGASGPKLSFCTRSRDVLAKSSGRPFRSCYLIQCNCMCEDQLVDSVYSPRSSTKYCFRT